MFKDFDQPREKALYLGSGFIIDKMEPITNNHVIQNAEDILVKLVLKNIQQKFGANPC